MALLPGIRMAFYKVDCLHILSQKVKGLYIPKNVAL